jgi:hypothetical protein
MGVVLTMEQIEVAFLAFLNIYSIDELVKTIFSHKDAKRAKKISFNINKLTLRPLRLCARPEGFYRFISIEFI